MKREGSDSILPCYSPMCCWSDITDAFVATPGEHQLARLRLLLESRLLYSAAGQRMCFSHLPVGTLQYM